MNSKVNRVIKYLLSLALAGVLVYFALRGIDWAAFTDGLRETRWGYALLFVAVSLAALVIREERWRAMMLPLDPGVRRADAWDAANVGNMTNVVLPGAGEFVRCAYISSRRMGYDKALGTIVCERAWDLLAVGVIFVTALVLKWDSFGDFFVENIWLPVTGRAGVSPWWMLLPLAAVAALAWAVYRFRRTSRVCGKIAGAAAGLWKGIASFSQIPNKWMFLLCTLGIWLMYILMTWSIFRAVPALSHLSFADALFISSIGNFASVIPVPGGIGAYHYLVALSLQALYGASWETGILAATLNHELHALIIIVVGVVSYIALTIRKKK